MRQQVHPPKFKIGAALSIYHTKIQNSKLVPPYLFTIFAQNWCRPIYLPYLFFVLMKTFSKTCPNETGEVYETGEVLPIYQFIAKTSSRKPARKPVPAEKNQCQTFDVFQLIIRQFTKGDTALQNKYEYK